MKRKELTDLRIKTIKDLKKLVSEKKLETLKNRVEGKNSRNLRREIAKILTLVREKEILEKLGVKNEEVKIK